MPIAVGYTDLAPETDAVLRAYYERYMPGLAVNTRYLARRMITDLDYMNFIAELWQRDTGFLLVEHDIVPTIDQLEELQRCPEGWCAFGYSYGHFGVYAGLGCVRFSSEFTRRHPQAIQAAKEREDALHPRGHWCTADAAIAGQLVTNGAVKHVHEGEVVHLRPGISHGCQTPP